MWFSDDTRYSFKPVHSPERLKQARRSQYGSQIRQLMAKREGGYGAEGGGEEGGGPSCRPRR
jgi:hypothetical protein